jgi:hypothetical protein
VTCDGTVTGFGLADPKLADERGRHSRCWPPSRQTNRPRHGGGQRQGLRGRGLRGILHRARPLADPDPPGPRTRRNPGISRIGCASASRRSSGPSRTSSASSATAGRSGSMSVVRRAAR